MGKERIFVLKYLRKCHDLTSHSAHDDSVPAGSNVTPDLLDFLSLRALKELITLSFNISRTRIGDYVSFKSHHRELRRRQITRPASVAPARFSTLSELDKIDPCLVSIGKGQKR
jgi:hypothetical protein